MASRILEGFSLTHAQILDGATKFEDALGLVPAEDYDIFGVSNAGIDVDTDDFANEGDDVVQSFWEWVNFAEIEVEAGYVSFSLISKMTGRVISSSGTGDAEILGLDLWHEEDFNVAPKPMLIRMLAKEETGKIRTMDIGLYKVQFAPISFDGPEYKEGLRINYGGRGLMARNNETGAVFADGKRRMAKLISRPRA